jgi:hypothetical protein
MKRRKKPFEDKVKKVQKAPRIRPLLGPGGSRSPSPGGKRGRREKDKARREGGRRGERDKEEVKVVAGRRSGLWLLQLEDAAVTTRRLASLALVSVIPWDGGRGFSGAPSRRLARLWLVVPSSACLGDK